MANNEDLNRILAKIFIALIIIIVDAGAIITISDGQTDGFGTVVLIFIMILATVSLGKACIER